MDKKVTFIFNEGRISRLMNKDKYPKDFFYSYHLFKNEFENALYKKIHEIRKNFTSIGRENDYESILKALSLVRKEVNDFFENVIVNDEEELIKKNRLELLQMLCKTFDNYLNFSKIESA